jgi:exopolysaccharide biosynthesis polyprenyl glycosylphosphotransferase
MGDIILLIGGIILSMTLITSPSTISFLGGGASALGVAITTILLVWRIIYGLVFSAEELPHRTLIVGAGVTGKILAEVLDRHPDYQAIGFIDDNPELNGSNYQNLPVLGDRHQILLEIERRAVSQVVLAITKPIDGDLLQLLILCHQRGIEVTPMPVLYEQLTGKIAVEHIGSQWYSALPLKKPAFDTFNRTAKRLLDIICGLMIAAIFAIVFPLVGIAIKLDSPGPIFYQQERVGRYGKKFTIYKFRSMISNAEGNGEATWAVKGDVRITKVGQFLRKTRLDELPQILNILRGEMSLVGPRPERPEFIDKLQQQIPFYRTRLAVKPGLTGWAQVNYGYGSTVKDALIKLQYDLYYQKYCSLWLDIQIILRTFGVVLKMEGQ